MFRIFQCWLSSVSPSKNIWKFSIWALKSPAIFEPIPGLKKHGGSPPWSTRNCSSWMPTSPLHGLGGSVSSVFSKNPPRLFHGLPGLQNRKNTCFPQGFGQQKQHVDLGLLKQGELMIFLLLPLIPMNTIAVVISPINNSWPTSKPIFLFLPFPFCRYIRGHCPGFSENWSRPIESLLTPFLKTPEKKKSYWIWYCWIFFCFFKILVRRDWFGSNHIFCKNTQSALPECLIRPSHKS